MSNVDSLLVLVVAMGAVTYLPRMLPLVFLPGRAWPPAVERFFRFLPYAALGALIVPGVFTSTGHVASATAGALAAALLAWWRAPLLLVVVAGIAGALAVDLVMR
ncbi:MAG TPA: AzlD domain-containing protein [Calditerricola sp.]